jgi:peptide/nickel transport system ATP-binding protein
MRFRVKRLTIKSDEKKLVDISFEIRDSLALVGESGSGKSLTLKALLGLLPNSLKSITDVESDFELNSKNISIVVQNPFTALSPMTKIKDQFFVNRERAESFFEMVGLERGMLDRYPSELSGGQLQRVIIAFALSNEPKLLLFDEPTTALDTKTKEDIISLIKSLHKKMGFKILFVTHEIELTKDICQDIAILRDGKIIESGSTNDILIAPKESYTRALVESSFAGRSFRE